VRVVSFRRLAIPLSAGLFVLLGGCSQTTNPLVHTRDYGKTAKYQIEISLNCTNAQNCTEAHLPHGSGFGLWLWLELNVDGKGDYTGADCGHRIPGDAGSGALADRGDLTREDDGTNLLIKGVHLFQGTSMEMEVPISVPDELGHYRLDGFQVFPKLVYALDRTGKLPKLGDTTQVQVAP